MEINDKNVMQFPRKSAEQKSSKPTIRRRVVGVTCSHKNITIDDSNSMVHCDDCGEKINPVWLLGEFMRIESQWGQALAKLRSQLDEASSKVRCKCTHCGKMTNIIR